MMTCKEKITEWLKEIGAEGLCGEDCGCGLDDLMPCDGNCVYCEPAMKGLNEDGEEIFLRKEKRDESNKTNYSMAGNY